MKLTKELIIKVTDCLGVRFINQDFHKIRLEIDARLEELNDKMMPDKSTDTSTDFIIPQGVAKEYVELMQLQDELMKLFEEVEV